MQAVSEHILCAGGMLDDEGKMKGSVLIVDFPDQVLWMRILPLNHMLSSMSGRKLK